MQAHTQSGQCLFHTQKSTIRRSAKRASYEKKDVYQLIDDLKTGHVGFVSDNQAIIIPLTVWRVEDHLYLHVANKSRLQKLLEAGEQVCISFAECSEWVMAKSAYHHSANYRSCVLFCRGERVSDAEEFDRAFRGIINSIEADRWEKVRAPSAQERKGTALMRLHIEEGSFKSRTGGPNEEKSDLTRAVWHGTLPTMTTRSASIKETKVKDTDASETTTNTKVTETPLEAIT